MKIQIVQAEIEAAIRQYIGEQITIKEGMQIDIDLRSTRGDAGFTADIDITPMKAKAPEAPKTVAAPVKKEEPAPKAPEVSQGKEQPEQPTGEKASDESMTQATETTNTETAGAEPASTEPQVEEVPAEAAAEPKRTLFAGLKRVNNG